MVDSLTFDRTVVPIRRGIPKRRRSLAHRIRMSAKRHAAEHEREYGDLCQIIGLPCSYEDHRLEHPTSHGEVRPRRRQNPGERRLHLEKDLRCHDQLTHHFPYDSKAPRAVWSTEEDEGLDLARSAIPLPSDRNRLQRQPSLGREDAFCDASTFKENVKVQTLSSVPAAEDAQVAQLYRIGLLYDENEQLRNDPDFGLNNIHHQEPIYTVRVSKRSRRMNKIHEVKESLHLNHSFTDLGNDDDLAQYLSSFEFTANESTQPPCRQRPSRQSSAPLRVIYELDSERPSFDVDTSQPPDLVSDSLSDYDCFSESELDDEGPSQREVEATSIPATEAWILLGNDS